jgi:fluoroacetyl-CoA thioesterase
VSLQPGIARTDRFTAEGELLTDVRGTLPVKVLATPGMIAMIEHCAASLALENLDAGKVTVGFEVCVKHVAAAQEGAECMVTAVLRDVTDGRKLHFDVEVREGDRTIGVGTHERRVVERAGFGSERP